MTAGEGNPLALAAEAAARLAELTSVDQHEVAVVLGTGLAAAGDPLGPPAFACDVAALPGMPRPTVPAHRGEVASLVLGGRPVLVFSGRTHLYEGRTANQVAHAVRTAVLAGCRTVILTNASGSLDPAIGPGSVAVIGDHINLTGHSPLRGLTGLAQANGVPSPFVDQTEVWSQRLRTLVREADPSVAEATYAQVLGPQFETPAEIRMLRTLGADLVGMSTAIEATAAVHLGAEVLGLSLAANLAAGMTEHVTLEGIRHGGEEGAPRLGRLVATLLGDPRIVC